MTETTVFSTPSILTATIKHWQNAAYEPPFGELETTRYLTPAQITAFLLAFRLDENRDCATLLTCTLLSGIPAINLTTARWTDLNVEKHVLVAYSPLSDNDEEYILNPPATTLLRHWSRDSMRYSDLIFNHFGDQLANSDLEEVVERIGRRAGIPTVSIDDLERSHEIIALGVALCDVPMPAPQTSTDLDDHPAGQSAATLAGY